MIETGCHRFIIGIGSQRAGSTLLHRLLETSSEVFMHPLKELHYFDTLYGYRSKQALQEFSTRQLVREVDRIVSSKDLSFVKNKRYRCYLRTNRVLSRLAIENVNYLDLFRPNLQGHSLLGEITPEYMLLDENSIIKMQQVIGKDAGVILICRNPVKRILSAVKLMNSYNNLRMNDTTANAWLLRMFESESSWIEVQDGYNDYAAAIDHYSRHFSGFLAVSYDDLINQPRKTAEKIAETLNLSINLDRFEIEISNVVNDLGVDFNIETELVEQIKFRYSKSQFFINEYFGSDLFK